MIITMARKARGFYDGGLVWLRQCDEKSAVFEVGKQDEEKIVTFRYGEKSGVLDITCSCDFHGKKGVAHGAALCSYVWACELYLAHKMGKIPRK